MGRQKTLTRLHLDRVPIANSVLQLFAERTSLETKNGRVVVCWFRHRSSERITRQWMTRGQDFYPVWHRKWGHGGTATTALAQLVRWIQGRPVLPLSTWRYWSGERVALGRQRGPAMVQVLEQAGYPETASCVLCGRELPPAAFDWWSLDNVSGPCCHYADKAGCRQQPSKKPANAE